MFAPLYCYFHNFFFIPVFTEIFVSNKYKGAEPQRQLPWPDVFMASNSTFPGIFELIQKCYQELNFVHSIFYQCLPVEETKFAKLLLCVRVLAFLVPVLHSGYLCYYTAWSQFVQFVDDCVRLLEFSPIFTKSLWREVQEIYNAQRSYMSQQIAFDQFLGLQFWHMQAVRHSVEKPARAYFFLWEKVFVWKKNYSKSSSRNSESILMT